jgi:hypothetical protein
MNGRTGEPVPVWGTVLGVTFSLLVGVGGVLLAANREESFTAGDAVVPGSIGVVIGLLVVGVVLWFYYAQAVAAGPQNAVPLCARTRWAQWGDRLRSAGHAGWSVEGLLCHLAPTHDLGWHREPPSGDLVAARARTR